MGNVVAAVAMLIPYRCAEDGADCPADDLCAVTAHEGGYVPGWVTYACLPHMRQHGLTPLSQ
ncbi:hypothetical protein [Streptomyces otsuchiensis]|uniref:hypothetical protein n=1 Tax=Streptomyces otsuchiensis TaxID=2681388 RepID=UPI001031CAAD|nr:hypothetical protein [Streptomyces otsuchiensis]